MPEYIEREAVYDIFSSKQQELLKFHRYYQLEGEEKEEFKRYDSYLDEIKAIPTADVVEVVRCKDCEDYNGHRYCEYNATPVLDDDFCSYGHRKEGADNG